MVAFRAVLVFFLIAVAGIANAQQTPKPKRDGATAAPAQSAPPQQNLGYDYRGQLVPQPRLAVNLFALPDDLPGVTKAEIRAFGKWMAETLRMLYDLSDIGVIDYAAVAAAKSANGRVFVRDRRSGESVEDVARYVDELTRQLKQRRTPRMQDPDMARALAILAKDGARFAVLLEQARAGTKSMLKAFNERDKSSLRDAVLDQHDALLRSIRLMIKSSQEQLGAAVGGTPDLWLWRADIEANQVFETMLHDMRHVIAEETLPPAVGRANIHENLVAMAEWVRRGEIQVQHELNRLRASTEPSLSRAQWLEKVLLSYQRSFQVERAAHAWLTANIPVFYAKLASDCIGGCGPTRTAEFDRLHDLCEEATRLAVERYELLAQMP